MRRTFVVALRGARGRSARRRSRSGYHGRRPDHANEGRPYRISGELRLGTSGTPVATSYQFYEHGPPVNPILVRRKVFFGATPFIFDFRPYIPRLHPRSSYTAAIHPDAGGSGLVTERGRQGLSGSR
jgi:hypothetical protein